ncbi:MFS transporter [Spelaeicoccus albus]|uniref:MFS family permease n=1 Tax=Spelaeicoccus albus TaxID=1280376 RepID=A0A7Z0D1K4_9MICO|nr:MFS transporter [Spelaeicoccus albus]NYI66235.1 MFS family permease [Spelaeicoccus albus]
MSAAHDLPVSWRNAVGTRIGWIAVAMVVIELIAGMQTYVTQTVKPLMAAELDGRHLYGIITAVSQIGTFITMPIGGALLTRFRSSTLLTLLLPVTALGSALCALAADMPTFLVGTAIRALAAGALATVGMGVIVTEMPKHWRRIVLAALSGVWVFASIIGPAYASWISVVAGWRWALVAYLPILFAARGMIARQLRHSPVRADDAAGLSIPSALLLAAGITLVSLFTDTSWWRIAACGAGVTAVLIAVRALLPSGVARLARGRPGAIAAMFVLCGVYFGASGLIAIAAHDTLAFSAPQIGVLLAAGGLGWAVVGFHCGRRPAASGAAFTARLTRAIGGLLSGLVLVGTAMQLPSGTASGTIFVIGWLLAGVGMGFGYIDIMNRIVEPTDDGIGQARAATAVVLAESVAAALFTTLTTTSLVSMTAAWGGRSVGFLFFALAALGLVLIPAARHAAAVPRPANTGASH